MKLWTQFYESGFFIPVASFIVSTTIGLLIVAYTQNGKVVTTYSPIEEGEEPEDEITVFGYVMCAVFWPLYLMFFRRQPPGDAVVNIKNLGLED